MIVDYHFDLWWACKQRPMWSAVQMVVIRAESFTTAKESAYNSIPRGEYMHEHQSCCYVIKVVRRG